MNKDEEIEKLKKELSEVRTINVLLAIFMFLYIFGFLE
jgi:hypothetical protein